MLALPRLTPGAIAARRAGRALAAVAAAIALLAGCGAQSKAQQIASCRAAIEHDLKVSEEGSLKFLPPSACRRLDGPEVRKLMRQLLQQPLENLQTPSG
jgi:ABC-type uncharacterized transport system auxiliary subunit